MNTNKWEILNNKGSNEDRMKALLTSKTLEEAAELLKLCRGGLIDKQRYLVDAGRHTFEIDEFFGENAGLVMAEVELSADDETYEKPDFIGREVTGDRRFYNSHLLKFPFSLWRDSLPEEYR